MKEDYGRVKAVLAAVLVLNMSVAVAKLVFGFLANSLSMMADAAHSFFDSTSNIIGLVGVYIACKPPDKDHPYGHSKYETFAAVGIGLLLFITAFGIVHGAVDRFMKPVEPDITAVTFAVMIITTIVNVFVSRYEYRVGHKLHSQVLVADSHHTRSDVYASVSVMIGFAAVRMGYPLVDPFISLAIAALIGRTAYGILKSSSTVLCDTSMLEENVILRVLESVSGIEGFHKIRTRGSENGVYVDLHMVVRPDMPLGEAHDLSHKVEERLKKEIPAIKDVVVHIEPS